jgi:gluconate 2-dehydrogenase gamma chain
MQDLPKIFSYADRRRTELLQRVQMKRRRLLQLLAAGAGALAAQPSLGGLLQSGSGRQSSLAEALEESPWPLLAAVQDHLFPSEPQAPGAREVNALPYLQFVLSLTDRESVEERKFITAGATWLRKRVAIDHDGRLFSELNEDERERALRRMAGSKDGENWLSLVLYYILEALLSDPVYGGNPDAIGWKWLAYTPGFPRPPAGKRYYELRKS